MKYIKLISLSLIFSCSIKINAPEYFSKQLLQDLDRAQENCDQETRHYITHLFQLVKTSQFFQHEIKEDTIRACLLAMDGTHRLAIPECFVPFLRLEDTSYNPSKTTFLKAINSIQTIPEKWDLLLLKFIEIFGTKKICGMDESENYMQNFINALYDKNENQALSELAKFDYSFRRNHTNLFPPSDKAFAISASNKNHEPTYFIDHIEKYELASKIDELFEIYCTKVDERNKKLASKNNAEIDELNNRFEQAKKRILNNKNYDQLNKEDQLEYRVLQIEHTQKIEEVKKQFNGFNGLNEVILDDQYYHPNKLLLLITCYQILLDFSTQEKDDYMQNGKNIIIALLSSGATALAAGGAMLGTAAAYLANNPDTKQAVNNILQIFNNDTRVNYIVNFFSTNCTSGCSV